jgi:hypothetical protein
MSALSIHVCSHSTSGLFFYSNDMNRERICNRNYTKCGKECLRITNRKKWITYLRKNLCSINVNENEKRQLITWVNNTRIGDTELQHLIDEIEWRNSDMLNY